MIEKFTKGISDLIPFLAAYPAWVRVIFSLWILLSAVLLLALLLARSPAAQAATTEPAAIEEAQMSDKPLWLSIDGVDLFGGLDGGKVKVIAKVNGIEYRYPSLEGIEWMEVSPTMSSQQFRVPRAKDGYSLRFTMTVRKDGTNIQMVSQRTDYFNTAPFRGRYKLYRVGAEHTRSATVEAEIKYSAKE